MLFTLFTLTNLTNFTKLVINTSLKAVNMYNYYLFNQTYI